MSNLALPAGLVLHPYQVEENKFNDEPGRQFLWDPRTGKTLEYVIGIGSHADLVRFLVVAPKLAAITTWPDTLQEILPNVRYIDLTRGTIADRAERLAACRAGGIAVVNPEALALEPLKSVIEEWNPRGLVVDEIHMFRSRAVVRSKALIKLADRAVWKRGGTGTLTPTSYANVYTPYRIVDPRVFGTSKAAFQKRYCIMDPRFYNRVIGPNNTNELQAKVLSIASVVRREARRTPPQDLEQRVILPPSARNAYDRLAKKFVLELDGETATISHRLARMGVLHQMAGGFVYNDGVPIWIHRAKIEALLEELETLRDTNKQALIYYLYDAEGEEITRALRSSRFTASFIGELSDAQREKALRSFQAGTGTQTLVMQEQMGIGIKLSRAKTCIFYSHSERHDVHTQARDRIWEQGDDPLLYVYLRAIGTADYFYRDLLVRKESESNALLTPGAFAKGAYGNL